MIKSFSWKFAATALKMIDGKDDLFLFLSKLKLSLLKIKVTFEIL